MTPASRYAATSAAEGKQPARLAGGAAEADCPAETNPRDPRPGSAQQGPASRSAPASRPRGWFGGGALLEGSILRQLIAVVLLLELVTALLLTAVAATHERRTRFRAFDVMLQGRAAELLGAVQDADDAADNVLLDKTGIDTPEGDLYAVMEEPDRLLGSSANWPRDAAARGLLAAQLRSGAANLPVSGQPYRFLLLHGVRVVDPGEHGGKRHQITIVYGASTTHVQHEVMEAVRFYAVSFAAVMLVTAVCLAAYLRRALSPLRALAAAAGKISTESWHFSAPDSAWTTQELRPLCAAIDASVLRLQQSFAQQRRFTSDAAHELKTDVAIIKSSLQLLAMRPRTADEYAEGVRLSLGDCDRLEQAVQQMLTLARVEHAAPQGQASAHLAWHAVAAARSLGPMAELQGIRIDLGTGVREEPLSAAGSGFAAISPRDCDLLCTNLLLNALQHSRRGGVVSVGVTDEADRLVLTVEDAGEGIPADALPHIFRPFYRPDDARARKHGGTGLGLAICHAVCAAAGGTIQIHSEVGRGTTVVASLPRRSAD